jgi:type II restriction/modification system DNA methylase subunit YeeA
MDTSKLKKFAQYARRNLIEQVQSKLKLVLADDSAARREHPKAVKDLEQKLNQYSNKKEGEEQLIEQVAYTWFNRFCALRFMDVNQYNRIMVLSPISGQFQPEILAEAKAGHLDDAVFNATSQEKVQGLLSGSTPSRDGQSEAYRLMIVAVCNDYHRLMPFLFQRIEDYTELLMPDDLLSGNSILAYTREAMTPENCESVESIGWLYQFYISEKKDLVFEGLKKNQKITPENIPAATQLFTPHWIVKYLVENSLGRLWMLNNPNSKVIHQMEFYINRKLVDKGNQVETDFLKVNTPEELKVCDSACGSGHILTYAYDLLYAIYLDANYDPIDIPELIITKNLYGIEIDERASELAAFALSMKALKGNPNDESNNRRRFFRNPIKPNICRLEKVKIDEDALEEYIDFIGRDLFTQDLRKTLTEFEEADNFGSLIQPTLTNAADILEIIEAKDIQFDFFITDTHKSVLKILKQTEYLSPKYHVAIANPPYMASKGMNQRLAAWSKTNYKDSKSDLYSMFMERNLSLLLLNGLSSMINMQSWMFLSSFEKLRAKILQTTVTSSMIHLGTRAFDSIGGEVVSTTAFILEKRKNKNFNSLFVRLVDGKSEIEKQNSYLDYINDSDSSNLFLAPAKVFFKIPGQVIAYWLPKALANAFENFASASDLSKASTGLQTSDSDRFLRFCWEVNDNSGHKWFSFAKGGNYRKWYGNVEHVVNWENSGAEIKEYVSDKYSYLNGNYGLVVKNESTYFSKGILTSRISTGDLGFRIKIENELYSDACTAIFPEEPYFLLGILSSKIMDEVRKLNPTINFQAGDLERVPVSPNLQTLEFRALVNKAITISKLDWQLFENHKGFLASPLIGLDECLVSHSFNHYLIDCEQRTEDLKEIEEEINRIVINDYNFEKELDKSVEISKVSLIGNSFYRYSNKNVDYKKQFKSDSFIEFISYSVACMFGRYSLDKPGIILANQGESLENYLLKVPTPSFLPDDDNVIPIIDFEGDWFEDDITERFKAFLKVTFGEEHFTENLTYVEEAIGKDIKKYFVKDFYSDHVKRYKKRPIYWMFSSPKGSFNALIYMHRYQSDTASVVLNDYLREFRTKLEARKQSYEQIEISASASQKDKTQAIKAIAKINKVLEEVNDYEHDLLYPLAGKNIEIDLDDGVKHNYPLFGKAVKKIPGLS